MPKYVKISVVKINEYKQLFELFEHKNQLSEMPVFCYLKFTMRHNI